MTTLQTWKSDSMGNRAGWQLCAKSPATSFENGLDQIPSCTASVQLGQMCAGSGVCGTDNTLTNCYGQSVYSMVYSTLLPSPPPPLPPPNPPHPPPSPPSAPPSAPPPTMWSITSGAGGCQLVPDKPWCVEDSGGGGGESGSYGNYEDCTMTALVPMSVGSVGSFVTESISYDYLKLGQSPSTKWGGSTGPSDVDMAADDTMVRSPARARHHHHHTAIARSSMLILIARSHLSHVPSHLTMADVAVGLVWKLRGLEDLRHETRTTSSATPANPAANPAVSASVATAQCASDLGVRRWLGVRHVLYDRTSGKLPEGL